jgi:hypothetical protein
MKTPPPSKAEIAMRMLLSSDIDATSEKKSGAPLPNAIYIMYVNIYIYLFI